MKHLEKDENNSSDSPGLLSFRPFRPPHSRTLEIRTRICFWHKDLLLLGQGLRLLVTGRLAWSSLTARFCLMRELARAAIFPPSHLWEGGAFLPSTPFAGLGFALPKKKLEQDGCFRETPTGEIGRLKWVNREEFSLRVPLEREELEEMQVHLQSNVNPPL